MLLDGGLTGGDGTRGDGDRRSAFEEGSAA
jgi:hypothetical protein